MDEPMHPWPQVARRNDRQLTVGVVVVNWNTRGLLARALYGLRHVVEPGLISHIVVVDNASDDGSVELGQQLADASAIHFISNERQRYHGPALTQGVNLLAEQASPVDLVWVLDTDAFILRPDVVRQAADALESTGAVFAGERANYDRGPAELTTDRLSLCCVLFDPTVVWQPQHPPFREDGEPSRHLQAALITEGHALVAFPFCTERYVLHLGRSTLAEVAARDQQANHYLDWAKGHRDPHYGLVDDGQRIAAEFDARYLAAAGDESTASLVRLLS